MSQAWTVRGTGMVNAARRLVVPSDTMSHSLFSAGQAHSYVLLDDPELAGMVPDRSRDAAIRASMAATVYVPPGSWDAKTDAHRTARGFGLLVLDGLLVRRIRFGERFGGELLGPGDLLRPQDHDGEDATLPFEATWRVLSELRLALLDRRWAERMAPFPDVAIGLTSRALLRNRRLANLFTVSLHPRLDERLYLLLWELADRFGRVHRDGVHIDLPLTHELISHLAGARRPSVSSALARLRDKGLLERVGEGWLLHGDPAGPMLDEGGVDAASGPSAGER